MEGLVLLVNLDFTSMDYVVLLFLMYVLVALFGDLILVFILQQQDLVELVKFGMEKLVLLLLLVNQINTLMVLVVLQ